MSQSPLITPAYRDLQVELHGRPNGYGGKGDKWAPAVRDLLVRYECSSVLDYGCGEGSLGLALAAMRDTTLRIAEYDPAIPGKDGRPSFADLVVTTDVLEHVEPDCLDAVLAHLKALARKVIFVVVATRESNKTMADGRNAHLIVRDASWWGAQFRAHGMEPMPGPASPLAKPSREWVAVIPV